MDRGSRGLTPLVRLGSLALAIPILGAQIGCTHLQRTELDLSRISPKRLSRIIKRNPTEPQLSFPGSNAQPQGWNAIAAESKAPSGTELASSRVEPKGQGAVPALRGPSTAAADQNIDQASAPREIPPARVPLDLTPTPSAREARLTESMPAPEPMPAPDPLPAPAEEVEAVADPLAQATELVETSRQKIAAVQTYRVKLTRQERVDGRLLPREEVLLNVRRNPLAIRLEWPTGNNQGREVLYSEDECEGFMHVKLGTTAIPVPPMRIAPDSPMALKNSRHPIQSAGLDPILDELHDHIETARAGGPNASTILYDGLVRPEGATADCHAIHRTTPTGDHWILYLEQESMLPWLLEAKDANGELLEYYRFESIELDVPELAQAEAFDPAKRFASAGGGFLGRLTRAAQSTSSPTSNTPTSDTAPIP